MFVNLYTVYGVVQPDNQYHAHLHCVCIHSQVNTGSCESHSDQILFFRCVATHGLNPSRHIPDIAQRNTNNHRY